MDIAFEHHQVGTLEYLTIPSFDKTGLVKHCFTTRLGGVSTGECHSLNLGFNRNDTWENVTENYKIITRQLGIDYKKLVFSNQVHEDKIAVVTAQDRGKGIIIESDLLGVDGLVTNERQVPIITFYADCVPLFFLDPVKKVIALTHSGWRGTVKQIGMKTIHTMKNKYSCKVGNILAAVGPSIGICHFEVDWPVAEEFYRVYQDEAERFIEKKSNGKYHIDLWKANILQLKRAGIKDENITLAKECTYCNKHKYFSHRGDQGRTGSLAAIMMLV